MIGITFTSCVALLVMSAICAFIFQNLLKLRVLCRGEGYLSKLIVGWVGAWIGSPVLGYWGPSISGTRIYWIPAIIGSLAAIYLCVASLKMIRAALALPPLSRESTVSGERTKVA